MLISNKHVNTATEFVLGVAAGANYSNAIARPAYFRTSLQCPTHDVVWQVSNKQTPDETTDTDWFSVGTGKFITFSHPFKWMRVKIATAPLVDVSTYVISVDSKY